MPRVTLAFILEDQGSLIGDFLGAKGTGAVSICGNSYFRPLELVLDFFREIWVDSSSHELKR